ncbi:MAG: chemotaxis protein CheD [Methylocystis sp.]|uniref:chemotaxis protein CheD n=1 Tax=Methylocystis sp. TaxID=1911079 RepID=UPI003DA6B1F4
MEESANKPLRKIHIIQGEYQVVTDADVVLSTVLGSCVAACVRDAEARVGGMNHFLLPGAQAARPLEAERYGAYLMELLINGLLKRGARRERIEAKLFGGARMVEGLSDIGAQNAAFAREFLKNEGIRIVAENLGGRHGRRLEYYPLSGRARQILLPTTPQIMEPPPKRAPKPDTHGTLELF